MFLIGQTKNNLVEFSVSQSDVSKGVEPKWGFFGKL